MTCEDGHKHCDYWAKNDECKKNPEWYISNVSLPYLLVIIETLILLHKSLLLQPGQFIFLLWEHHCLFLSLSILGCWSAALSHAISARTSVTTTTSIARYGSQSILIRLRCFCLDLTAIFRIGPSWANARRTQTT